MRRAAVIFAFGLAYLTPCVALARGSKVTRLVTIHAEGVARQRGIGPVRLEEPQSDVTRSLGPGRETESGTVAGETYAGYDYRSGPVTLEVGYANGLVSGVSTRSGAAMLFGHPLADGLKVFRRILHGRRGWRIDECRKRAFTALAPGGPGTGIEWKDSRLKLVMIDVGGVLDDCAIL